MPRPARNKVTVIGAGNVGATTAQRIAEAGLADVVLVDIVEGLPQGKALDLAEAAPVVGHDARITGTNDYADTAGSRHRRRHLRPGPPAGHEPRRPAGQERRASSAPSSSRRRSTRPDAILIIVTNPLDAMCHVALEASRLPARARPRHGRRARLGPLPDVHRAGARRHRSRTPTPSSSAATATRWCRCRATRRSPACRSRSCCPPDRVKALVERTAQRRRGGRGAAQDRLGLLRAGRVDVRDGRVDPARPQARSCRARSCSRASSDATACSSACRSSSARAGSSGSSRSS